MSAPVLPTSLVDNPRLDRWIRFQPDRTVRIATGKVAHTGKVMSVVSYDSADQPYAGIAAREDTENRLASDAAQKIEIQLAAWMASQPSS